jgi:hypothetical protein
VIASRAFAVLSAVFFVLAAAIALDGPVNLGLADAMQLADAGLPEMLHSHASPWLWEHMALPVMRRPAWLVPTALALVCAGLSLSLRPRTPVPGRKRWWS